METPKRIILLAAMVMVLGIIAFFALIAAPERSTSDFARVPEKKTAESPDFFSALTPPPRQAGPLNPPTLYSPSLPPPEANMSEGAAPYPPETILPFILPNIDLAPKKTLPLPETKNTELAISAEGAASAMEYLEYLATHGQSIGFANEKMQTLPKAEGGLPLLPHEIIEQGIQGGGMAPVRAHLLTYKEFLSAKIAYLKSIAVTESVAGFQKDMIGLDRLTILLIEKALGEKNSLRIDPEFAAYFEDYKNTILSYNAAATQKLGISKEPDADMFGVLLQKLGLAKIAQAINPFNFGAMIYFTMPCTCSFGNIIYMGQPKGGSFFLSWATYASPAIFAYKSIRPGAYMLGLYAPTPIPCMQIAVPSCFPSGIAQGIIYLAGTSP